MRVYANVLAYRQSGAVRPRHQDQGRVRPRQLAPLQQRCCRTCRRA